MIEEQTKTSSGTVAQWPPLAHIAAQPQGTVKEGDVALCGAKLMGINLDEAHKTCDECIRIFKERTS